MYLAGNYCYLINAIAPSGGLNPLGDLSESLTPPAEAQELANATSHGSWGRQVTNQLMDRPRVHPQLQITVEGDGHGNTLFQCPHRQPQSRTRKSDRRGQEQLHTDVVT